MDHTAVEIQWNQQTSNHVLLYTWSKLIQVYDAHTENVIQVYDEHIAAKTFLDWNPTNPKQFVSGSNDCKVKIFSIDDQKCILEFMRGQIECVKYNPHNPMQIASCQRNNDISIWDMRKQNMPIFEFTAHIKSALYMDWHPTQPDVLMSGSQDNTIKVWDIKLLQNSKIFRPVYQI